MKCECKKTIKKFKNCPYNNHAVMTIADKAGESYTPWNVFLIRSNKYSTDLFTVARTWSKLGNFPSSSDFLCLECRKIIFTSHQICLIKILDKFAKNRHQALLNLLKSIHVGLPEEEI